MDPDPPLKIKTAELHKKGKNYPFIQCFGSGSESRSTWIPIKLVAWIRIPIPNADPECGSGMRIRNTAFSYVNYF
jgi:hypothetical protein